MDERDGSVSVGLAGTYPIFRLEAGQLVQIERADPSRRYRLETNVADGTTRQIELTDEEEAAANDQKAAWDAGADARAAEERRVADEVAKFEASLRFETRLVAFVDVLGWGRAVEEAATGKEEGVLALGRALFSMQWYGKFVDSIQGLAADGELWPGDPKVSQFSDSLLLSFSNDRIGVRLLTQALETLTSVLIPHGLLLRGGVVRGKLFHQGVLAFGPAMNEAYRLEHEVAVHPRIILSEDLSMEWAAKEFDGGEPWRLASDGHRFFNFLPPFGSSPFFYESRELWQGRLNPIRELILSMAADRDCPDKVFAKYEWLAGYFDSVCSDNPACGVDKVLEEAMALRPRGWFKRLRAWVRMRVSPRSA